MTMKKPKPAWIAAAYDVMAEILRIEEHSVNTTFTQAAEAEGLRYRYRCVNESGFDSAGPEPEEDLEEKGTFITRRGYDIDGPFEISVFFPAGKEEETIKATKEAIKKHDLQTVRHILRGLIVKKRMEPEALLDAMRDIINWEVVESVQST